MQCSPKLTNAPRFCQGHCMFVNRHVARLSLGSLICLLAVPVSESAEKSFPHPILTRGPYLQLATTNSICVVWRTDGPASPSVHFGQSMGELAQRVASDAIIVRASLGGRGDRIASAHGGLFVFGSLAIAEQAGKRKRRPSGHARLRAARRSPYRLLTARGRHGLRDWTRHGISKPLL